MHHLLIKICGIRDAQIAQQAALSGVNFIGIVFHPGSKRYVVDLEQGRKISSAARAGGAIPVAVFVDHSAIDMRTICSATDIHCVQLHGCIARQQHYLLPENYQRIYVRSAQPCGDSHPDKDGGLRYCHAERDFILFDNEQAGSGKTFAWDRSHYCNDFRLFLAGGLTADNVGLAITQFKPAAVDVSSGVENQFGDKDMTLIKKFICAVKGCYNVCPH